MTRLKKLTLNKRGQLVDYKGNLVKRLVFIKKQWEPLYKDTSPEELAEIKHDLYCFGQPAVINVGRSNVRGVAEISAPSGAQFFYCNAKERSLEDFDTKFDAAVQIDYYRVKRKYNKK